MSNTAEIQTAPLEIQRPQIQPLIDEPLGVVVTGCAPRAIVEMAALVDVTGAIYDARATFLADDSGTVNTALHPSQGGTYSGVDPFGLWWSGRTLRQSTTEPLTLATCQLKVESGGRATESVVERRWVAPGVTLTPVREQGVVGLFARPAGEGPFPGAIAFVGSSGGLGAADSWAATLAAHGIATLAIAYFGLGGLPQTLVNIEVEVVERAVEWLRGRTDLSDQPLAVIGLSRGSELALLSAALLEHIGPVVVFSPSGISWSGLGTGGPVDAPAWTFRGQPVPYLKHWMPDLDAIQGHGPLALRPLMERALEDAEAVRAAEISVERITSPVLMVSGEADAMWPAVRLADIAVQRAAQHGLGARITHLCYPDAGHLCGGAPGLPVPGEVRLSQGFFSLGGTPAGNARARADSWPRVLAFLADAFGAPARGTDPASSDTSSRRWSGSPANSN
jgi:dienelactone hydrolase